MDQLKAQFRGCLLGAMIGDVIGAVVEGESSGYIRRAFSSVDDILSLDSVPQPLGAPPWQTGRFTDDTQMTVAVTKWLLSSDAPEQVELLRQFAEEYQPWRRYGAGAIIIIERFMASEEDWQYLNRIVFPTGSYGNGSAMRVAPVGLFHHNNFKSLIKTSIDSSQPTHCHPLACQGAILQSSAVAAALRMKQIEPSNLVSSLRMALQETAKMGWDTDDFSMSLDLVENGVKNDESIFKLAEHIGNGITALAAVPMAITCFLKNLDSFEKAVHDAVFIGGDTDTIASMTAAIAGAYHGEEAIPQRWLDKVKEEIYTVDAIRDLADQLSTKSKADQVS